MIRSTRFPLENTFLNKRDASEYILQSPCIQCDALHLITILDPTISVKNIFIAFKLLHFVHKSFIKYFIFTHFQQINMATKLYNPLQNVPKLDYTQLIKGEIQADIISAMREFAFFYVVDIPEFEAEAELEVMREFFSLPLSVKERYGTVKLNPNNANVFRGTCFIEFAKLEILMKLRLSCGNQRYNLVVFQEFNK